MPVELARAGSTTDTPVSNCQTLALPCMVENVDDKVSYFQVITAISNSNLCT
jgi:hypothetical protein